MPGLSEDPAFYGTGCLDWQGGRIKRNFLFNFKVMTQELVSVVWQIHGLIGRVTPGVLIKNNDRIQFVTEEGIQFDEPVTGLKKVSWPFLRMGLGFDTLVNEKKYQFSFAKPNPTAPELDDELLDQVLRFTDMGRLAEAVKSLKNLKADKATTKAWKKILEG